MKNVDSATSRNRISGRNDENVLFGGEIGMKSRICGRKIENFGVSHVALATMRVV